MKVFLAGTFDGLHIGHQWLLWTSVNGAKEMIVIVARDETVEKIRGRRSLYTETERLERLQAEQLPNAVIRLGRSDGDFLQTLQEEAPDVLILGFDQDADETRIRENFPDLEIRRAEKYFPEFFKSSHFRYTEEK